MILYHGSPIKITNDQSMASGTYFTEDIEIARDAGEIIYCIEVTRQMLSLFTKDIFNEHWISRGHIPLHMFEIVVAE